MSINHPTFSGRRFPVIHRLTGFTLVELLVVIGVISLLIAMLMPALNKVRQQALRVQCASQLRQFGIGFQLYAQQHRGAIPSFTSTSMVIFAGAYPYWLDIRVRDPFYDRTKIGARPMYYCPNNELWNRDDFWSGSFSITQGLAAPGYTISSYCFPAGNTLRWPDHPQRLGKRSKVDVLAADITRRFNGNWSPGVNHAKRNGTPDGGNVLSIDGHVEYKRFSEMLLRNPVYGADPAAFLYW